MIIYRIFRSAEMGLFTLRRVVPSSYKNILYLKPKLNFSFSSQFSNLKQENKKVTKSTQLIFFQHRYYTRSTELNTKNRTTLYYLSAFTILVGGCTYASVLLYRLYCQTTGKGGQAVVDEAGEKIAEMKPIKKRNITVNFNADTNSTMMWNFKPQQPYIKVSPGETALAFYTAINPTDKPITGVATYNVLPFEAGKYFNKIQCFCFEEQQLNPHEEVDMPVFFYLDPEYAEDPRLETVDDIILSYTFFEAKQGMQLPRP
ncbi:Cytochrome c oxidase assembly protein COX11, mitochondrial, partial [Stegodyphus mimosarum]